jgi:hypothetical protein
MEFQSVSDALVARLSNCTPEGLEVMKTIMQLGRSLDSQSGEKCSHVVVHPSMLTAMYPDGPPDVSSIGGYTLVPCEACPIDRLFYELSYEKAKETVKSLNWKKAVAESNKPKDLPQAPPPEPPRGAWEAKVLNFPDGARW